jgi:pSer/pThr/pTyr-binding forkhead associated (FHA) protein
VPPGKDGTGNDVALDDKKVSRLHCEISWTDKGWLLTDLDSTNGSWLDGKRVERAYLSPGSTLMVLDCGSIPENLIESELFGHEKGSFTGATGAREGAFD